MAKKLTAADIQRISHILAVDLFTNVQGTRAERLAMIRDCRDVGGWGLFPMRDRINLRISKWNKDTAPKRKRKAVGK